MFVCSPANEVPSLFLFMIVHTMPLYANHIYFVCLFSLPRCHCFNNCNTKVPAWHKQTTCNVICSNVCSRLLQQRMSHQPMTQSLGRLERLAWVKLSDRQIDGASPGHNQKTSPVVRHLPLIINVIFKIFIIFIYYYPHHHHQVLLAPVTGRRHQLRLHCHRLGHTIVGDFTYSGKRWVGWI